MVLVNHKHSVIRINGVVLLNFFSQVKLSRGCINIKELGSYYDKSNMQIIYLINTVLNSKTLP